MEIIRRNTDYALRLMVHLAVARDEGYISSRILAEEEDVSHQLTCKLLQKLHDAGLVLSSMGSKGGFKLKKSPAKIKLTDVIDSIQGPILINRCLLRNDACPRQKHCPITTKLGRIQKTVTQSLDSITLGDLLIQE
ncbi:MAG: Rrf2 family transcriptional regulator [Planctomycetes bacterium]|nr:Rrf2 family transcriptional regulator [Planctomycetota bacterium]